MDFFTGLNIYDILPLISVIIPRVAHIFFCPFSGILSLMGHALNFGQWYIRYVMCSQYHLASFCFGWLTWRMEDGKKNLLTCKFCSMSSSYADVLWTDI